MLVRKEYLAFVTVRVLNELMNKLPEQLRFENHLISFQFDRHLKYMAPCKGFLRK